MLFMSRFDEPALMNHCASYDLFAGFSNTVSVRCNMQRPGPNVEYAGYRSLPRDLS